MYINEFNAWLEGYMDALGIEEEDDIPKKHFKVILAKLKTVHKGYYYPFPYYPNTWTYTNDNNIRLFNSTDNTEVADAFRYVMGGETTAKM